jgi:hypothetical protein
MSTIATTHETYAAALAEALALGYTAKGTSFLGKDGFGRPVIGGCSSLRCATCAPEKTVHGFRTDGTPDMMVARPGNRERTYYFFRPTKEPTALDGAAVAAWLEG